MTRQVLPSAAQAARLDAAGSPFAPLLLPDEDPKSMPPAGLPRLSGPELGVIIDWIRDGAAYVDYSDAKGSS